MIYRIRREIKYKGHWQNTAHLFNLSCGVGNFGKIWTACGQHEIHYTSRMNKYYVYV